MFNNWFARTSEGFNAWAAREASGDYVVSPSAGVLRLSGNVPLVASETSIGAIDGGGEIAESVDQNFALVYDLLGAVEQTFTVTYQMVWYAYPTAASIRLVGQTPTVAYTRNRWVSPTVGTIRFTPQTPTVTTLGAVFRSPSTGTVRFVGNTPTVEKGERVCSPSSGMLRFFGMIPTIQATPIYRSPESGRLHFLGQQPTVISPFYVSPTAGTIRFKGFAIIGQTFTATWQVLSATASQEFVSFYTINGSVSANFSSTWNIESRVCSLRHRVRQRRITSLASQRRFTVRPSQRTIRIKACANQ